MEDLAQAPWRTSSHSRPQGEQCVEVAPLKKPTSVAVRDSKHRDGGAHVVSRDAWQAFITHIKLNA
jgi:hypothetical protein